MFHEDLYGIRDFNSYESPSQAHCQVTLAPLVLALQR